MGLSLQSLSITQTINSIISYFRSQENNSKWKELTSGAEGLFLIRMLANIITNISYRLISARRENYISTLNLLPSALGLAVNYGYSAYRGSNQRRLIRVLPNGDYNLPKFSVVGSYQDDYSILTLDDVSLSSGVSNDFSVAIGTLKEISWTAGTNDIKLFQQFTKGISEDFQLLLDGEVVPTTSIMKQLVNDKYLVRTNPYSSVDVLYLNNSVGGEYKYGTESVFTLRYIELADVPTVSFTDDMINYGQLTNTLTIDNYVPFESVEDIKINAPLSHEVQSVIKAKEDYVSEVPQVVPNITKANYDIVTPTYTEITYLKDNFTLLTDSETDQLITRFNEEVFFGTPVPDITPPVRNVSELNIFLKLNNRFIDVSDINIDIENILQTYYSSTLSQSISVFDVEKLLENSLSYVEYARVSFINNERSGEKEYQLGQIIINDGIYYRADSILGVAGSNTPSWSVPLDNTDQIDTGLTTEDGAVIWKTYKRLPSMSRSLSPWSPLKKVKIGEYVYDDAYPNFMFKCVDLRKFSGSTSPDLTLYGVGDFVEDNQLVWVIKEYNISLENWTANTNYSLGTSVNLQNFSLECVSYSGKTQSEVPSFEKTEYDIASSTTTTFTVEGNYTQYFEKGSIIKAVSESTQSNYVVDSSRYDLSTNSTIITVLQQINLINNYTLIYTGNYGTIDGDISWKIESSITDIKYDWNVYNLFSYELETAV